MSEESRLPITPELREFLLETVANPVRNAVFIAVSERPGVTAREIATRLEISPRSARHHLDRLLDGGMIEASGETARRNTRVYHYRTSFTPIVTGEDFQVSADEERQFALAMLRILIADARSSVAARTFGLPPHQVGLRVPAQLDERGWSETSAILMRALDEVMTVRGESAERLRASGEEGSEAITALLLFEAPPWEDP